jgi:aryl-alcohol dehydrogenase-like predicted oxidoreductase
MMDTDLTPAEQPEPSPRATTARAPRARHAPSDAPHVWRDQHPRQPRAATAEGTGRFATRFGPALVEDFYRAGPDGIRMSSLGIGTYLGECDDGDDSRYEQAIGGAIGGGINVVDSAINYRCQRSERAVGRALGTLLREGSVARDEVVVCTKGGYIPLDGAVPPTRAEYDAILDREYYAREVMTPADVVGGGHCISPAFVTDQVARSRANLGVSCIDVYYLHNPEQQLPALQRSAFMERLTRAFEALEARVEAGDIGVYGCATWNGLRAPPGSRDHLSLEGCLEAARAAAGDAHHFRVVQLPLNLAMSEAVRARTQRVRGREMSVLQAATELGITLVASATLMQSQLARNLPPAVRDALPPHDTDAQRALAFVRTLPGVTTALVGMRDARHVAENLAIATR